MIIKDKTLLSNIRAFAGRHPHQRICFIPELRAFDCQGDRYYPHKLTPELIEISKLGFFYIEELCGEEEREEAEQTDRFEGIKQHAPLEGSLDYDLFVIDSQNTDTTAQQLRDCIKDALEQIISRVKKLEEEREREKMNIKELAAKVKEWNKTKSIKLASDICRELAESMGCEDGRN